MTEIAKSAKDDSTPPGPARLLPPGYFKDWGLTFLTAAAAGFLAYAIWNKINEMMEGYHTHIATGALGEPSYLACLAIAGFIAGAMRPKAISANFLGSYCGQVLYLALTEAVTLWFLMALCMYFFYSAFFLAAAAVAAKIRLFFFKR